MDINCISITDPLLFEVTLSELEKNVQKILQVQSQLLRNQNSIFERLNELESKFKTFQSTSTANTPKAAPRNLFSPKVMSPEWYRDVESPATYHPSAAADVIHLSESQPSQPPILPSDQPILPPNQSPHATTPELQKKQSTTVDSSIINKANLLPVNAVIAKYPKLKTVGKAGPLAVKLARESFFGDDVLVKCTVHGSRALPGLSKKELAELKQTLFNQFPQYWGNPAQFESIWANCLNSINQCNKRLRTLVPIVIS